MISNIVGIRFNAEIKRGIDFNDPLTSSWEVCFLSFWPYPSVVNIIRVEIPFATPMAESPD